MSLRDKPTAKGAEMETQDLDRIRFVTQHFNDLQGLRYEVPLGLATLGAGGLIHFAHRPLAFLPAFLFLPAFVLLLWGRRHYRKAYGEVEPQPSDPVPVAIFSPAGPISRLEDFEQTTPIVRHVSVTMGLALAVFLFLHIVPQTHFLIGGHEALGQHPHIQLEETFLASSEGLHYQNEIGYCSMRSPSMLRAFSAQTVYLLYGSFLLSLWFWRERRPSQGHHLALAVLLLGLSLGGLSLGFLIPFYSQVLRMLDVLLPVLVYPGLALLLCGSAMILTGLLDHQQLVRALGQPETSREEQES
jgi:hypothetical protein